MTLSKCPPSWIFRWENHIQEDWIDFWPPKLTLKTENVQFLTVFNQKLLQDIKKSSEEVHLDAQIYWISTAPRRNFTAVTILIEEPGPNWTLRRLHPWDILIKALWHSHNNRWKSGFAPNPTSLSRYGIHRKEREKKSRTREAMTTITKVNCIPNKSHLSF